MTRMRRRLIDDFLVPALDNNKYPGKLYWIDKETGVFRLYWSHKNAAKWQSEDTIVFQDWDKLKGHFKPEVRNYFMSAKQRFRAALYKLSNHVTPMKSVEKTYRDYKLKINENGGKRQNENLSRSKAKGPKRTNQCEIRPSVICKNTAFVPKAASGVVKKESKSPSPIVCSNDTQMMETQYTHHMEQIDQLKAGRNYVTVIPQVTQKFAKVNATSVLRENSSTPRVSHIAPQPVPVYSFKHNPPRTHEVHNAPPVMVSSCNGLSYIFAGPENLPETKNDSESSMDSSDGILNLSLKSSVSDTPSR